MSEKLAEAEKALADLEQHRNRVSDTRNKALLALRDDAEAEKPETQKIIAEHKSAIDEHDHASNQHLAKTGRTLERSIDIAAQAVLDAREEKA